MTDRALIALLDGEPVGRVLRDRNGRMTFVYEDGWRHSPDSYPLSLSMPLAAAEHPHARIDTYLWGLLPDNANILDRWARRFRVSARNPFALLAHVGEDCAGAVQFATQERIDTLMRATDPPIEWLDEQGVAVDWRRCESILPRGAPRRTPASSALRVLNPKQRSCSGTDGGAFPPVVCPPRTF